MNCPYCGLEGTRMATHRHLLDVHGAEVRAFRDEERDRLRFALDCPFCDEGVERTVNPRGQEPDFLDEFRPEITLVAFDLLLYHLDASHAQLVGREPIPSEEPTQGGTA